MAGSKELNKYLKELNREELIKEVTKLYNKFKLVKEHYASELGSDNGKLLESNKAKLKRLILKTGSNINPDLAAANTLIRDFASVSVHKVEITDLMLYKVEMCVAFLDMWGLEFSAVTRTVSSTYQDVLGMIYENKLEKLFAERCAEVEGFAGYYGLLHENLHFDDDDEPENS